MLTARQENEKALARLAGISEEEASRRLDFKVAVRGEGAAALALAGHVAQLLAFTVEVVGTDEHADLELAINVEPSGHAPRALSIAIDENGMNIFGEESGKPASDRNVPHDLAAKLAACYAAGAAISLVARATPFALPFNLRFATFGLTSQLLSRHVVFKDSVLVGAGGVANGFLWAIESLNVQGSLDIADPKVVAPGNLNRARYFTRDDIGTNKAVALATNAKFAELSLEPFEGTFKDLRRQRGRIKRAIVTVDSRRARRAVQSEFPLEVLDASTTDVSAVVVHSHAQPTSGACLSCIYSHIPLEDERLRSIAEGLGLGFDDIEGKEFIDAELAKRLADIHGLDEATLEGTAIASLHKSLCAADILKTPAGEQSLAPFAFISNLAGVLLAIELLLIESDRFGAQASNYLTLDPWAQPHGRARRTRTKNPGCEFCSKSESAEVMAMLWSDWLNERAGEGSSHVA